MSVFYVFVKRNRERDLRQIWEHVNSCSVWVITGTGTLGLAFSRYLCFIL